MITGNHWGYPSLAPVTLDATKPMGKFRSVVFVYYEITPDHSTTRHDRAHHDTTPDHSTTTTVHKQKLPRNAANYGPLNFLHIMNGATLELYACNRKEAFLLKPLMVVKTSD